ncbi:MAG: hypothetical protein ABW097_08805 [Candidatus Thiodiazotropha lotti]
MKKRSQNMPAGLGEYDSPEKLKILLESKHEKRELPFFRGAIARRKFERQMAFTITSLCNYHNSPRWEWSKKVVDDFEKELKKRDEIPFSGEVFSPNSTPLRLEKYLRELVESGDVPTIYSGPQAGELNRRQIARNCGFPISIVSGVQRAPWAWFHDICDKIEEELKVSGALGTVWEKKVPKIREVLDELHQKESLPVNGFGKLARGPILQDYFDLPKNQSVYLLCKRAPAMDALFDEFDEIIEGDDTYSAFQGDASEKKLKVFLEGKSAHCLELSKNRRNLNLKWLAKKVGIDYRDIQRAPRLTSLIESKEKELHEYQRKGTTAKSFNVYQADRLNVGPSPYSDKYARVFSFEVLIEFYELWFTEKVATVFLAICESDDLANPKASYLRILHFLTWLSDPSNGQTALAEKLRDNKVIGQVEFNKACLQYQAHLSTNHLNAKGKTTPQTTGHFVLSIITKYGSAGVFPEYTFLNKPRNYNKDRQRRLSLVEAPKKTEADEVSIETIRAILDDAARYRSIEFESESDVLAFTKAVALERENNPDLPKDLPVALLRITEKRLLHLRKAAAKVFDDWRTKREALLQNLPSPSVPSEEIGRVLSLPSTESGRRYKVAQIFPKDDPQQASANVINYIVNELSGVVPVANKDQIWRRTFSKVGGRDKIADAIMPPRRVIVAVLTLYLAESGANMSVAQTLKRNCLTDSDLIGHKIVTGIKPRAGYKAIYDALPSSEKVDDITGAVFAIDYISDIHRQVLSNKNVESFASYAMGGELCALEEFNFRSDFQGLVQESDYLKDLHLVPSMVRPTVLLESQLNNPVNLGVAQLIAKHESDATTYGYVNKLPYRIMQDELMLEYQNCLEVVYSSRVDEAYILLGKSEKEWEKQMSHAKATGMGVFCHQPPHDSSTSGNCESVENCIRCKSDRMLVSADIQSIAEMIVWRDVLQSSEKKWLEEHYDRWTRVWAPWKAFFDVVLDEKMARGKLVLIRNKAATLAERCRELPEYKTPELW